MWKPLVACKVLAQTAVCNSDSDKLIAGLLGEEVLLLRGERRELVSVVKQQDTQQAHM